MKIILTFIFYFVTQSIFAQLEKGIWHTGGLADIYSYNQEYASQAFNVESKSTQINLSSNIGYFVMDKFSIGLKPGFSSSRTKTNNQANLTTNLQRYSIGPFARYYLLNMDNRYNLVTEASYQWGFLGGEKNSGSINNATILVGPVIYFNSSVGLEFLLGYKYTSEKLNDFDGNPNISDRKNGFFMGIGFQIHLQKDD
jgi:long-subunit fatty acid transport protein